MSIDPNLITTIRVDQLPDGTLSLTNLIAHVVGTDLKKATIQDLADLIAAYIGSTDAVGYCPLSVTDGQQLPAVPANPSFFLCGAGTYLNINGYPDIVCTEELNVVMSLTDHWELSVQIPITAEIGVQSVTGDIVDITDAANPVVITPNISQILNVSDLPHNEKTATVTTYTFALGDHLKSNCLQDANPSGITDIFLDASVLFPENAVIRFYTTKVGMRFTTDADVRTVDDLNTAITEAWVEVGDYCELKQVSPTGSPQVWILTVLSRREKKFEVQLTQAGTDAPDIVADSIIGAMGANISTTYNTDGEYYIVSDKPIFAKVKDYIKNSAYIKIDLYTVFDGFNTYAISVSYVDDYTILLKSYNYSDLFSVYLSNDIMQEPTLIQIPFKP